MPARRLTHAVLILVLLILAACGGEPEAPAPEGEATPPVTAAIDAPPTVLDPEELSPNIQELSEADVGPTKIVIELAKPVADASQVNQEAGEGTLLTIDPPVPGKLTFTGPSTLTFVPEESFRPSTTYTVELEALATPAGVLQAPEAGRWVRVFTTPAFDFARFALTQVDYPRRRAEVELVFSGPVKASEVEKYTTISLTDGDGRPRRAPSIRFVQSSRPHTVLAQLAGDTIQGNGQLHMTLDAGVPSSLDDSLRAGSRKARVDLSMGPQTKVLAAYRAEGTNGFYVQVVCDDTAVPSRRYYWDRNQSEYYQVSTRCQIDEADAAFGIHFDPKINASISPAAGGFRIFGDFERGTYHMRIDAGVKTVDGGMLHKSFETELTVPARSPSVRFVSKGRYLPRTAWASLPVRHLNLSSATLTVRHVPADNLVFWMSDDNSEAAGERTSDLILNKTIELRGDPDVETTTYVDLASLVPANTKGLIELRLAGGKARDTARILLTDLHLVAKRAGSVSPPSRPGERRLATQVPSSADVRAWALDMDSLEPVRGAEMRLIRKSGYVVATCRTGRDGGCDLRPQKGDVDPSQPFAVVASSGEDLTYLKFNELKAEVQEESIAGVPYADEASYRAAIYSDRGVYRPGETAHLAAIVREKSHRAPAAGLPVVAELVDPRGKAIKRSTLKTNAAGYLELDLDFPAFAATGRYEAKLAVAEKPIGQYRFQVEEFVPERMKVEVGSIKPAYQFGEPMDVDVGARYLFGGVPSNHRVEVSCEIAPSNFKPRDNANFHYGVWNSETSPVRPLQLGSLTGELDGEGAGTYRCPGEGRAGGFRGPAQLIARAAVFESGSGRTTVNQVNVPVHPESYYIGLSSGTTKLEAGDEMKVEGVTVDWQGALVDEASTVELQFIRLEMEYGWYYDESRGRETYRRYLRPVTEDTVEVPVLGGKFEASWKAPRNAQSFLVRASSGGARTDLEIEGGSNWYWWAPQENEVDQTPRPGRPAWVALQTPDKVQVGERFPVQLKAPYQGRALLTVETDRILRSEWIDIGAGDTVWFVELDDFAPNVYVTAFLVKDPYLDSPQAFLPDRAFGVRSVTVEPREFTHTVQLDVPEEVRSSSRLEVTLDLGKTSEPTYATVAAVDEGILSLTRFRSPDPFATIFERRALGVETFETVGWTLLVPPSGPSSTAGGDGAGSLGRVQPVKPVALYSGLVEVPSSGKLELAFDVPQYRGELRVMAVTAGSQRMGHAEASVTVRDPLVVQSTLPRFLTRDDEIRLPVHVTNVSGQARDVEVVLESEMLEEIGLESPDGASPVEILGSDRRSLSLADGAADTALSASRRGSRQAVRVCASRHAPAISNRSRKPRCRCCRRVPRAG